MEVARKMQVDLLHGQHLGITTAGSPTLLTETWTQRRFTQRQDGFLADAVQSESKTHRHGGLANAGLRGTDGSDKYEVVLGHLLLLDGLYVYFSDIFSMLFQVVGINTNICRDICDRS